MIPSMVILRQYIAPLLVVLVFLIALVAVSARIFLPSDMASPAPIEEGVTRIWDNGQDTATTLSASGFTVLNFEF